MILEVPPGATYFVVFQPSGDFAFQPGRLGHYRLDSDHRPTLNPYGGMNSPPDAWQPLSTARGIAAGAVDDVRRLRIDESEWISKGFVGAPCTEDGDLQYNIATNRKTTTSPIAILLRDKAAPVRLDCDPRADKVIRDADALVDPVVSKLPSFK